MKQYTITRIIGIFLLALFLTNCSNILEEEPRIILEPGYFKTEKGVNGGLTSLYAHLRYIYGNAYFYNSGTTGTDEATYAQSADGNFKVMDISGQEISPLPLPGAPERYGVKHSCDRTASESSKMPRKWDLILVDAEARSFVLSTISCWCRHLGCAVGSWCR